MPRQAAQHVGVGGIWHETNSLVPSATSLDDFDSYQRAADTALIERYTETGTELGGVLAACAHHRLVPVPLAFAAARPSGVVSSTAFAELMHDLVERVRRSPQLDAVVLCLHGAMVVEGDPTPELTLVEAVRRTRAECRIAVTLDYHANLGRELAAAADVIVGYKTYPHVDCFETGHEAVDVLADLWAHDGERHVAFEKLPLVTSPHEQSTESGPMADVAAIVEASRQTAGVTTLSVFPGYPYARSPNLGFAIYGVGPAATEIVSSLAGRIWQSRSHLQTPVCGVAEAAAACARLPPHHRRVLADAGDNVGGGSPGDGTALLAALAGHGQRRALGLLWAPEAVAAIHEQTSDTARVVIGEPPLELNGPVRRLGTIAYHRSGSYMAGQFVSMGRVAVISAAPGTVVLTEERVLPFDRDHITSAGIDLEGYDVIVVKSAVAWRAAFSDWATDAVVVDSPGYCPANLAGVPIPGLKRCYPVDLAARRRPGGAVIPA